VSEPARTSSGRRIVYPAVRTRDVPTAHLLHGRHSGRRSSLHSDSVGCPSYQFPLVFLSILPSSWRHPTGATP
jgi:hypothetical protein